MATSRSDATLSPHRAEEGIPRDFELAGNEDDTSSNEVRPNVRTCASKTNKKKKLTIRPI